MRFLVLALAVLLGACAYVGDPVPPSLRIPEAVNDLRAVQKGSRIYVEFTPPVLTTDGVPLDPDPVSAIQIGEAGTEPANSADKIIDAAPWVGKEIVIGVRTRGRTGRWSGWSNLATMRVSAPIPNPAGFQAEPAPDGIRLTWTPGAVQHRIFRDGDLLATAEGSEFVDRTAELGKTYSYSLQAVENGAESEERATAEVTRKDIFPPAAVTGLTILAGVSTVELAWERSAETDIASYRIYRDGAEIARDVAAAAFSDANVRTGGRYRYSVSAVDTNGNEGPKSAEVEVILP